MDKVYTYENNDSPLKSTWKRHAIGWLAVEKNPISAGWLTELFEEMLVEFDEKNELLAPGYLLVNSLVSAANVS